MRYSDDYKKKAVELYRQGLWPDTPDGYNNERFHGLVRTWVRISEAYGMDALNHKEHRKEWTPLERYTLVTRVLNGESFRNVAYSAGTNQGLVYHWVRNYQIYGYNGLVSKKKTYRPRNSDMKKVGTRKPPKPDESEYEELIRLRAENECMRAEIEIIKKEIALREEKEAARLKAKKQRSSKNSDPKDSN